jgi:membrane protein DedA with SNARE-associated domain
VNLGLRPMISRIDHDNIKAPIAREPMAVRILEAAWRILRPYPSPGGFASSLRWGSWPTSRYLSLCAAAIVRAGEPSGGSVLPRTPAPRAGYVSWLTNLWTVSVAQSAAMSSELVLFITRYGYLAIFMLVFLQELGVPNPVTNEFVLLFSGYLAFAGVLNLWLVVLTAVSADCIGTTILYAVFYRFGEHIMRCRPRWFPISRTHIDRIAQTISERRQWGIYLGRLIPFLRGYASVAAGILPIRPKIFLPAVIVSAITWSGGYVIAGKLLGPYWEQVAVKLGLVEGLVLLVALFVTAAIAGRAVVHKKR